MLKVLRLDISTYQKIDFQAKEKLLLENLAYRPLTEFDSQAEILISNSNTEFHKIKPSDFPKLQLVIHPNSGYDNVTLPWAQHSAPIIIGHEIRMNAVAEYTLSCLFEHFTKPPFVKSWDKKRSWERKLLKDQNIQLIGYGHIGKILEKSLAPLVKNIWVYDPYKNQSDLFPEKSDIIILAASLNPSSEKMINEDFLKKIPRHALIINGARGKLIDQKSIINFFKANQEAYAYLDVFEIEPTDMAPFENLSNVKLSSHVAGVYTKLDEMILKFEEGVLMDFKNLTKTDFEKKYSEENLQNRIHQNYIL